MSSRRMDLLLPESRRAPNCHPFMPNISTLSTLDSLLAHVSAADNTQPVHSPTTAYPRSFESVISLPTNHLGALSVDALIGSSHHMRAKNSRKKRESGQRNLAKRNEDYSQGFSIASTKSCTVASTSRVCTFSSPLKIRCRLGNPKLSAHHFSNPLSVQIVHPTVDRV